MSVYQNIDDASIVEFRPVTARLMRRYSRNIKAIAIVEIPIDMVGGLSGSTAVVGTFTTVATLRVFCAWGGAVRVFLHMGGSKDAGAGTAAYRMRDADSGASSVETSMSANTLSNDGSGNISFTAVANTIRLFELQGKIVATGPGPGVGVTVGLSALGGAFYLMVDD